MARLLEMGASGEECWWFINDEAKNEIFCSMYRHHGISDHRTPLDAHPSSVVSLLVYMMLFLLYLVGLSLPH